MIVLAVNLELPNVVIQCITNANMTRRKPVKVAQVIIIKIISKKPPFFQIFEYIDEKLFQNLRITKK